LPIPLANEFQDHPAGSFLKNNDGIDLVCSTLLFIIRRSLYLQVDCWESFPYTSSICLTGANWVMQLSLRLSVVNRVNGERGIRLVI